MASSTAGWEIAEVAWGRPRGGFVRDFFAFDGVDAIVCGLPVISSPDAVENAGSREYTPCPEERASLEAKDLLRAY